MDRLTDALQHRASEIRDGLQAAYRERDHLREREKELTEQIERAEEIGRASCRERV